MSHIIFMISFIIMGLIFSCKKYDDKPLFCENCNVLMGKIYDYQDQIKDINFACDLHIKNNELLSNQLKLYEKYY